MKMFTKQKRVALLMALAMLMFGIVSFGQTTISLPAACANCSTGSTNGTAIVSNYGNSTCTNPSSGTINGTLTQGVAASGVTMTLYANVTQIGNWNISTIANNGVTFSGSGTFTSLGCQPITLTASGTPTSAGPITVTTNTTPAGTASTTVASSSSPSSNGTAVVSAYGGVGCTGNGILNGTYVVGQALTSANTLTYYANVTQIGTWNITTVANNGVTFSGSGTFTSTGCQVITLTGSGTPTAAGSLIATTNTSPSGSASTNVILVSSVSALNCSGASTTGTLRAGVVASGVSVSVPYTAGNGGTYSGQTVSSTGVTGLTATLASGSLASGSGSLTYTISGTPSASGTANFAISVGGQSCTLTVMVSAAALPANITLSSVSPYFIASVYDTDYAPYTTATGPATLATNQPADGSADANTINVQGTLTTTGVTISIPYVTSGAVSMPAFSQTITIPAEYTEDGISRDITLSYGAVSLAAGSGNITATIKAVGGTLNVKKLDVQTGLGSDALGFLLGQFTYATNSSGGTANLQVRDIVGIPDRNITDPNHVMFYLPVTAEDGNVWLNNNLGADYANSSNAAFNPAQQATSATDHRAYGSLFQWGRYSDGHELINWSNSTTGFGVNGITSTLSTTDTPGNSLFIVNAPQSGPVDWRNPYNLRWQGVNGINNPCPNGFRVPTEPEVRALVAAGGTFASKLKLAFDGQRFNANGTSVLAGNLTGVGSYGTLWTSTVGSVNQNFDTIAINYNMSIIQGTSAQHRTQGFGVRCIKN